MSRRPLQELQAQQSIPAANTQVALNTAYPSTTSRSRLPPRKRTPLQIGTADLQCGELGGARLMHMQA